MSHQFKIISYIHGRLVLSESTPSVSKSIFTIPVQNLPIGIYTFKIQTENALETRRFVVANKL